MEMSKKHPTEGNDVSSQVKRSRDLIWDGVILGGGGFAFPLGLRSGYRTKGEGHPFG